MDLDEMNDDFAEMLEDFEQLADFITGDGKASAYGVPVVAGDVSTAGGTDAVARRVDLSLSLTVARRDLPFEPKPGTTVKLDGKTFRVIDCSATPGDVTWTLSIANTGGR